MLVFILDSGVSVSLTFGPVGLYLGLGHFSVVVLLGHAMLACCCVLFSPYWANVEPPWSNICRCWVMSGNVGPVCVGPFWAMLGLSWATLAPYWAHVEPSWAMLRSVLAFVLDLGISASLDFRSCKAFATSTVNK